MSVHDNNYFSSLEVVIITHIPRLRGTSSLFITYLVANPRPTGLISSAANDY